MRISDWSSDVCSSDLDRPPLLLRQPEVGQRARAGPDIAYEVGDPLPGDIHTVEVEETGSHQPREPVAVTPFQQRSEERRVGQECYTRCKSRWSPYNHQIK